MTKAKKETANDRMIRTLEHYRTLIGNRPWTGGEVAEWALEHGLYPFPGIRSTAEECQEWDKRFEELTKQKDRLTAATAEPTMAPGQDTRRA
jgi:hypothetical protein